VWTPADYGSADNANRRYNVLYVLDGALDQDFEHIAGLGQLGAAVLGLDADDDERLIGPA